MNREERLRRLIQFQIAPLLDLVLSLLVLTSPERFGTDLPWVRRVRERIPPDLLAALQERSRGTDLFALAMELEDGPARTVESQLAALEGTHPELARLLTQYWQAVAPELAGAMGLLADSLQSEQERLARMGPVAYLSGFSDRIRVVAEGEALFLAWGRGLEVPLAELERILFVPSAFCPRRVMFYRLGKTQIFFYRPEVDPDPEGIPESLLLTLTALADPTRLRLLRLIARDSLPAQEMARRLGVGESTVSRHLRTLMEAGLVARDRQEGRYIYYTLEEQRLDELADRLKRYLGRS
ncbi:MAG: metalloregulator ArsR/SmtB family transcription factor [Firmicutes bacterium]|nr:metalloregulator ArsR/SmtB family transcription factor [Bacillota bacterium]